MKRFAAVFALCGAAACTGLWVDKGNDFPCDFRAPEAERDKACTPGEVCGVDNICRPFHYEGPQFEGKPGLPRLDAGVRLHPGTLDSDARGVAINGNSERNNAEHTAIIIGQSGGSSKAWFVDRSRPGAVVTDVSAQVTELDKLLFAAHVDRTRTVAVRRELLTTPTTQFQAGQNSQPVTEGLMGPVLNIRELRTHLGKVLGLRGNPLGYSTGAINQANKYVAVSDLVALGDGGTGPGGVVVYDVALANPRAFGPVVANNPPPLLVALTPQGFAYQPEALIPGNEVWQSLHTNAADVTELLEVTGPLSRVKVDQSGRLFAVAGGVGPVPRVRPPRRVLSTWSLVRGGLGGLVVERPWSDCSPCGGNSYIVGLAPFNDGQLSVEVICASPKGQLSGLKVVGSTASDPVQPCSTEPLDSEFELGRLRTAVPPVDFSAIAALAGLDGGFDAGITVDLVQDNAITTGVAVGGRGGRVYAGGTFSKALPQFLDRLPQAVGSVPAPDGGTVLAALTDRYAAARISAEGFEVIDLGHGPQSPPDGVVVSAFVGEAPGWLVLSTGDVVHSTFVPASSGNGVEVNIGFGPRLLTSADQTPPRPYFAEAVTESDGTVRTLVLTAFDSLYMSSDSIAAQLTDSANTVAPLLPALTPEPNSPIRSFALERSVLGTDGRTRARGYVATARSLYLIQYGGTPARWSSTPLVLTGETPTEVWMDHPRGGLGRVGYPSGEVYSLPGAFLLSRSLAASGVLEGSDGGVSASVDDYENLGGWPVAYSQSGVFVAGYPGLPDGGLDNKQPDGRLGKPMRWARVRLSNGTEPWLGKPGRLYVVKGPRVTNGSDYTEDWTLVVFTADEAYEAGFVTRTNVK